MHNAEPDIQLSAVQPADIGWPTGNGKKLSKIQACCLAQLCLAAALFLSISCGPSYVRRLYVFWKTAVARIQNALCAVLTFPLADSQLNLLEV